MLKVVESVELPTLAVDQGWRMYYNPEFVMQQSPEVLATMVLHEGMHCVLQHGARFGALKQQSQHHSLWNLAGDANINEVLDQAHMPWGEFPPVRFETLGKYGVVTAMTTEQSFFQMIKYFEEHPEESDEGSDCGAVSGGQSRSYEIPKNDRKRPARRHSRSGCPRNIETCPRKGHRNIARRAPSLGSRATSAKD